jgi:lipopolysaccharide transport system permease protein
MRLWAWVAPFWQHRDLLGKLTLREIAGRYRGSMLGWTWSVITPLLMLAVYTLVFSQIFRASWPGASDSPMVFALNLFAGLICFNLVAECLSPAPQLILQNQSYVTKVVFPLELLAGVRVGASTFHALTSLLILMIFRLIALGNLPLSLIWLPLIWLPLLALCLSSTWILSGLGVYLRDLQPMVQVGLNMLVFLSAVFYPVSALPAALRPWLSLNPVLHIINQTRRVCMEGLPPQLNYGLVALPLSLLGCAISFHLFQRLRRGFADVL